MQVIHLMQQKKIITEITNAMTANLMNKWIIFPQTEEARNRVKIKFSEKFNIPGVIGTIDCTHIAIVAPSSNDPVRPRIVYYNRKGYYSLNVQLICDANLKIIACNARFPGSCHDSAIWSWSIVRQHIEQQYLSGNLHSSWLIGDSGYGLQPWLLTPIVDAEANSPEDRYTRCQMSARNTVERCIGVLKQKFRCLLKHRVLHYDPVKSAKIVYCCAMLHNMSLHTQNLPELDIENNEDSEIELDIENHEDSAIPHYNNNNENWFAEGQQTRQRLIENYFT